MNKNIRNTVRESRSQASILSQALPFMRRYAGQTIVIKYGGHAMGDNNLAQLFANDIVLLKQVGIHPIVVHGGGPQIGQTLERMKIKSSFIDGLRVTDAETLDIARMVLVGKVNREIVGSINAHGPLAVGVSGEDGGLITAAARNPDLGFVGDVTSVDPTLLEKLFAEGLIPVMSTIGADASGQAYNINADTVAGAIAQAMKAEKVLYLTDVEGLYEDLTDEDSLIGEISADELQDKIENGEVTDGMIPKTEACIRAVKNGVTSAHLIDGRIPHVALLEIFTDAGIGTMITD